MGIEEYEYIYIYISIYVYIYIHVHIFTPSLLLRRGVIPPTSPPPQGGAGIHQLLNEFIRACVLCLGLCLMCRVVKVVWAAFSLCCVRDLVCVMRGI